jgi:hypothetical protein
MSKAKDQVITITCKLHDDIEKRLRAIERHYWRIEGENWLIIALVTALIYLTLARVIV